jgi:hypothetical protein
MVCHIYTHIYDTSTMITDPGADAELAGEELVKERGHVQHHLSMRVCIVDRLFILAGFWGFVCVYTYIYMCVWIVSLLAGFLCIYTSRVNIHTPRASRVYMRRAGA